MMNTNTENTTTETTPTRYAVIRRHFYYPGTYNAPEDHVVYVAKTLDFARKEAAELDQGPDPRYDAIMLEHGQYGGDRGEVAKVLLSEKTACCQEQIDRLEAFAADNNGEVLWGEPYDCMIYVVSCEAE